LRTLERIYRNVADAFGLFIVPAIIAALPWRIGYGMLKALSQYAPEFEREADVAWKRAATKVRSSDAEGWKARMRLVRWVERVDAYSSLLKSNDWWARQVDVAGAFPSASSPSLLLTYHWGAGNWIWKLLRDQGIDAYFLVRRPVANDFGTSRVASWYARMRERTLPRLGCAGLIYTGGSGARMREVWARAASVLGMVDVPVLEARKAQRVRLLDAEALFPSGLLQLAVDGNIPVTLLSCGLDLKTGRRRLRMERVPAGCSVAELAERYAAHLDARLRESPEAWHMWHETGAIFIGSEPVGNLVCEPVENLNR
jgi:hypothetical protein